jgi:hypothetical protein
MSRSGLFNFENEPIWLIHDSHSLIFFNLFGGTVSAIFEILGLKYSNGTGYLRYSRLSRCPGLLSGARDAERPSSSKCRHDCRLPRGPGRNDNCRTIQVVGAFRSSMVRTTSVKKRNRITRRVPTTGLVTGDSITGVLCCNAFNVS